MGVKTRISWCDHTWNCWRGCFEVSPGCDNCYARTMSLRNPNVLGEWGEDTYRAVGTVEYWRLPFKWDKAAARKGVHPRVFTLSLGDWLELNPKLVPLQARLLGTIAATPYLEWLLLTKRPEYFFTILSLASRYLRTHLGFPGDSPLTGPARRLIDAWLDGVAPPNVRIGITAESQETFDLRVPLAQKIPARSRFISAEPLLTSIYIGDRLGWTFDWLIVGGESGSQARPFDVAWARHLVKQCRDAKIAPFVKQFGSNPRSGILPMKLKSRHGDEPSEWQSYLQIQEFPPSLHTEPTPTEKPT